MASIKSYKTYMFRDKDPVIDELRTMFQDTGVAYAQVGEHVGIAEGTIHNWFHGETRRPQSASIEAVGRFFGKKRVWQNFDQDAPFYTLKKSGELKKRRAAPPKTGKKKK